MVTTVEINRIKKTFFACFGKTLAYLRSIGFFQKSEANYCYHILFVQGRGNIFYINEIHSTQN